MDASKESLIQRLQKEGKITQDEAYLLRREKQKEIEYIPGNNGFPPIRKFRSTQDDWMENEMEKRQRIAENCSCNPAKGGSGICGCTLTGPIITC
jgi:hypothetical protein